MTVGRAPRSEDEVSDGNGGVPSPTDTLREELARLRKYVWFHFRSEVTIGKGPDGLTRLNAAGLSVIVPDDDPLAGIRQIRQELVRQR
jgi:hypothetical protein